MQNTGRSSNKIFIRGTEDDCSLSVHDTSNDRVGIGYEDDLGTRGLFIIDSLNNTKTFYDKSSIIQNNNVYNFPNKSGTLALTSDIPEIPDTSKFVTTDTNQTITGKKVFGNLSSNNKTAMLQIGSGYGNRLELSAYYPEAINSPFSGILSTYTIKAAKEDVGGLGGYRNLKLINSQDYGIIIDAYGSSVNATGGSISLGRKEGNLEQGYPFTNGYFTGTLQAASLSDGTTTKTMTEVLSGGGGSTTYMHSLKLSSNDAYSLEA